MWTNLSLFKADKATSIKDHEIGVINHGIINLSTDKFVPVPGVTYLWTFTQNEETNEPGDIYLGVENPMNYPEAFHEGIINYLRKEKQTLDQTISQVKIAYANSTGIIREKIREETVKNGLSGRGHATLAVKYDKKGNAIPTKVYIAGELYFEDKKWYLNNKSGRFYYVQDDKSVHERQLLLEFVAQEIEKKTQNAMTKGIKPITKVIVNKRDPEKLWQKFSKEEDEPGLVGIALHLIMRTFKYYIPSRIDSSDIETKSHLTPEYNEVKTKLHEMLFTDLRGLVNYLNQNKFFEMVKESFKNHNQTMTEELESNLKKIIEFIQAKSHVSESVDFSATPSI